MTDPVSRLGEVRKQLQIVADEVEDERLVKELHEVDALVERLRGEISDKKIRSSVDWRNQEH